jgi:hypothetical protein
MKSLSVFAGATMFALAMASTTAAAQALPIVGGTTTVKLTSAPLLGSAGVSVGLVGSATLSPGSEGIPQVFFPVSGGSFDTASFAGSIEHDGSGLTLTTATGTLTLTDFVIDTVGLRLSGEASFAGTTLSDVPLFDIGLSGSPFLPFSLSLTATAAGALTAVLGLPDLTGTTIGLANTLPITSAVPEPATIGSMLAGVGLMGLVLARRRAAARQEG